MATGIYSWSQTAATNATADSTINWAEGQAPSTVNDSSRAVMAVLSKWRDDISGVQPSNAVQTTAGTATALTLVSNLSIAALTNGWTLTFKSSQTNTGACTLAVDGLTAKAIQRISGSALVGGEIITGSVYTVTYHQPADSWVLHSAPPRAAMEFVATGSAAGAATMDIVFSTFTQYRGFVIKVYGVLPSTDGANLGVRFSTDAGSNYLATGYNYVRVKANDTDSVNPGLVANGSTTEIQIALGVGSAANEGYNGSIELLNPFSSAFWPRITFGGYFIDSSATPSGAHADGGGSNETAQDVTAIRFLFSAGNITGTYAIYGLN